MRGHRDLRLVIAATLVCAVGGLITPLGPVRVVFATPLALVLPGYALTAALFGANRPERLQSLPLTLGVSLASLALGSLLLNYVPGGIGGLAWVILLVLMILLSCAVAARRRGRPRRDPGATKWVRLRPSPLTWMLGTGSLVIATAALVLAQVTLDADNVAGYTQLWVAPPGAADGSARLGVTSEQQQRRYYRLEVEVDGRSSPIVETFDLAPSETHTVTVRSNPSASPVRLAARLYLRAAPHDVYRKVSAWLPARGAL